MAFNPTEAQRRAIETRNSSILLSAAAGSGKTATLTRRIIESLTDPDSPLELSRMLIVTFTRAAAAELRERISAALTDALASDPGNSHLNRQTILLGGADICTIDSFCLDVVRANFQRLSLDDGSPLTPDFRLADDTELDALRLSVMNSVIDKWYDKADGSCDFAGFAEIFSGTRDEGTLVESLIGYAEALESLPDPKSFTLRAAEEAENDASRDFFATAPGGIIKEHAREILTYYLSISEAGATEFTDGGVGEKNYRHAFLSDADACRAALSALEESYSAAREALFAYSPVSLKVLGKQKTERSEGFKELREGVKKGIRRLAEGCFLLDVKEIQDYSIRLSSEIRILDELIADYSREYSREKHIRRILEFADIKRLCHSLLVNADGTPKLAALELREKYDAVYIDEYQDVDRVQDEIFSAVAKPGCRFVVGDIKQSIYSFRGAEPSIFGALRDSMPKYGTDAAERERACSIFMSENFRCDRPVIDFVNRVSRHSFVPAGGVVGYRAEDDLVCGKAGGGEEPVTVAILPVGNEVDYIVSEITKLLETGKKNDGTPIRGSDIAVLCRGNSMLRRIGEALAEVGIESSNETASDFFGNPEILLALSLVTAIDNPEKDIPLAAALRSPFFGFTLGELVRIKSASDPSYSLYAAIEACADAGDELGGKCAELVKRLTELRADSRSMAVDMLIRRLYREFSVMSLTLPGDRRTPAQIAFNLRRFYEYARSFAASQSSGLSGFIRFIDNIIEGGTRVSVPSVASREGAVTLMSIHKSKGLEFPVVFVGGCGKSFNRGDLKKTLVFEPSAGVSLKLTDETGFARADTPQRAALAQRIGERQTEEEMRILYVALTRARERLYVTSEIRGEAQKLLDRAAFVAPFDCRVSSLSATRYLDWILPAVVRENADVRLVTAPVEAADAENAELTAELEENYDASELVGRLRERLNFVYPHAEERLPAKLSVSRLYPDILDDDGAETLRVDIPDAPLRRPLFLQETADERHTAAERGTATHIFMQFCDMARAERGVREEIARLVEARFIPAGVAELVNVRQLERFFAGELYASLKEAKRVFREQRFNILLPAERFTADPDRAASLAGEKLLVQGVIDLLFIDANDRIVLCDYKTDYLTPDELADESAAKKKLFDRHGQQLGYYSDAVEQLLGKRPDRVCLYSLPLGKALDVTCGAR